MLCPQQLLTPILHFPPRAPQQKAAALRERRHQRHRPHAAVVLRRQEHAGIARMHGEPEHLAPELGNPQRRVRFSGSPATELRLRSGDAILERVQIREQALGPLQRFWIRLLQPGKAVNIVDAGRLKGQHHLGEVEPLNLGQLLGRTSGMFTFRPQPHAPPRRRSPGPPRPLVGRRRADLLDQQRVDAAMRIVAGHPREAAVDHRRHTINRQRGFRHVG